MKNSPFTFTTERLLLRPTDETDAAFLLELLNSPKWLTFIGHLHYHIIPRRREDGQQLRWKIYPEWRSEFDALLDTLR